ncbi:MAG: hypothetical protein ACREOK_11655 [Gemmatimonadaceae bacterium]
MRVLSLTAVLALAACSSSSHTPPDPTVTPANVRVSGTATTGVSSNALRVSPSYDVSFDTIYASVDKIWSALPAIYTALSIPLTTADPQTLRFGNEGMKVRRRLGETSLVKLLDCGRTQIGQNADSYEIVMSVVTTLARADVNTTVVATGVQASGSPLQFGGSQTRCRTKGELERQIALALSARFNK